MKRVKQNNPERDRHMKRRLQKENSLIEGVRENRELAMSLCSSPAWPCLQAASSVSPWLGRSKARAEPAAHGSPRLGEKLPVASLFRLREQLEGEVGTHREEG